MRQYNITLGCFKRNYRQISTELIVDRTFYQIRIPYSVRSNGQSGNLAYRILHKMESFVAFFSKFGLGYKIMVATAP